MFETHRDTDHLCLSARLHGMAQRLLTAAERERMLTAPTEESAIRVLTEHGYLPFPAGSRTGRERSLRQRRETLYERLGPVPEPAIVTVFRLKYDCHNLKVLLKSRAEAPDRLLLRGGNVPPQRLRDEYLNGSWRSLPPELAAAVRDAQVALERTGDPRECDRLLDRACFARQLSLSRASGVACLADHVRLRIDSCNLRSTIRLTRLGRQVELGQQLLPGGQVPAERILSALRRNAPAEPFLATPLREAAQAGLRLLRSEESPARFDCLCDRAVLRRRAGAVPVPFGPEVLLSYLLSIEAELRSVGLILSGRMLGLPASAIRERLREADG